MSFQRKCAVLGFAAALNGCASPSQPEQGRTSTTVRPLWLSSVGTPYNSLSLTAISRTTVIVGGTQALFGLDAATGRQKWRLPVPFQIPRTGIVLLGEANAVIVSNEGFVTFETETGREIRSWYDRKAGGNPSQAHPLVLPDGRILHASRSLELLALNPISGRIDTLVHLPGDTARHPYIASLTLFSDTVYAPVASDALRSAAFKNTVPYRYALRTGVLDSLRPDVSDSASLARWLLALPELLVSGTDYSEASWLGFDRATGERRWKVPAAPGSLGPSAQAALVGDTLFTAGNDGRAYVIHLPSGRLIRTQPILNGLATGVAACGGEVVINVIGELVYLSRDGRTRRVVGGLSEGKDTFSSEIATAFGIAVIGGGGGDWIALPCPPP